jgi:hypothetical protein
VIRSISGSDVPETVATWINSVRSWGDANSDPLWSCGTAAQAMTRRRAIRVYAQPGRRTNGGTVAANRRSLHRARRLGR